jgi:hypothetical protein
MGFQHPQKAPHLFSVRPEAVVQIEPRRRRGWNVIRTCLETTSLDEDAKPGASIAVHTYGDFLNFNPHLHAIVPDGCFLGDSDFRMAPMITGQDLSEAFRHEVLTMLKKGSSLFRVGGRGCGPKLMRMIHDGKSKSSFPASK